MKYGIFGLCGALLLGCSAQEGVPEAAGEFACPVADSDGVGLVEPTDGSAVGAEFVVLMDAGALVVEPAGTMTPGTAHMHLLVDVPFVPAGQVIPADQQHRHYGDGSLTATLSLEPGEHVLRLLAADGAHRAYGGDGCRDEISLIVN